LTCIIKHTHTHAGTHTLYINIEIIKILEKTEYFANYYFEILKMNY